MHIKRFGNVCGADGKRRRLVCTESSLSSISSTRMERKSLLGIMVAAAAMAYINLFTFPIPIYE